jgi:hypothetical protein
VHEQPVVAAAARLVGLPRNDRGAAGPLLAALGVDLDQLREAVTVELSGSGHEPAGPTRPCRGLPAGTRGDRRPDRLGPPAIGPSTKTPATVTLAPGATRPAGLAVTDLGDAGQLPARFNADQGMPRLVLALAPT